MGNAISSETYKSFNGYVRRWEFKIRAGNAAFLIDIG
jgi:hypothetical protein